MSDAVLRIEDLTVSLPSWADRPYAVNGVSLEVMRKEILRDHPWVARNLYNAFQESKRRSIERLLDPAVSRYPLAWLPTYARTMRDTFGSDPFPYGIEENRATWEQMALYCHQQGIAHRQYKAEEIFPRGMMTKVVI